MRASAADVRCRTETGGDTAIAGQSESFGLAH
jgi:hypothetical protein